MELFKYRNLTLGSFLFLVTLFASYYFNTTVRIAALVFTGVAFVLLILIPAVSRGKHGMTLLLRFMPTVILVSLALLLSLIHFNKSKIEGYVDGKPHEIVATVKETLYSSDYLCSYTVTVSEIDGCEVFEDVTATVYSTPINERAIIKATGCLYSIKDDDASEDIAGYYLSHGITLHLEIDNYRVTGTSSMGMGDYLKSVNEALSNRFASVGDDTTHGLLCALFLGNKSHLSDTVKRDFSRIGLSHVLALSGMHIAVIVTLLGYALYPLRIHRMWKEAILILATLSFVALTGFSESAMRAGIMVSLAYALFFFGNRISLTTALFYSATIICAISPFSVFSLSLQLSFLAMLGCIFSSKIIHRVAHLRTLKPKPVRYVIYTLLTSLIICLFTLPLVSVRYGRLSLLSPLSNVLLGPLFTALIFLSPVFLMVADIPYVSNGVGWLCRTLTGGATSLGGYLSSGDNVSAPIMNTAQLLGVLAVAAFLFLMLVLGRRIFPYMIAGACVGISIFVGGTVFLFCEREGNVYVSAHSFGTNDVVCVEDSGDVTVIDITATSRSCASYVNSAALTLGYYEIDNYVITDYSGATHLCFTRLSENTVVRRVYLRTPDGDGEVEQFNLICNEAKSKGIEVFSLADIKMESSVIRFSSVTYVPRSTKRAVAFSVECENATFAYLGASTYEVYDKFIENIAHCADVAVFGSYGPKYKTEYGYNMPFLDHALFLGESKDHASGDFYRSIKNRVTKATRFKLTP